MRYDGDTACLGEIRDHMAGGSMGHGREDLVRQYTKSQTKGTREIVGHVFCRINMFTYMLFLAFSCILCLKLEDEFHFLLECALYIDFRKICVKKILLEKLKYAKLY